MMLIGRLFVMQDRQTGAWERRLRIGPHPMFFTKVRAAPEVIVPSVVRNPKLGILLAFLFGKEEAKGKVEAVEEETGRSPIVLE